MFWALYSNRITLHRPSAFLVESQTVAATLTLARQPGRASKVEVTVSGGSGTVTVTGTVAGVAGTSEVLTFDGTMTVMQTSALFETIESITTTGLAGRTISVRAIGRDGSAQVALAVIVSGWPASLSDGDPSRPSLVLPGKTENGIGWWTIPWSDTFTPRPGDFIDDERGQRWEVLGVPKPGGGLTSNPWHVRTQRREGDS